MRFTKMLTTAVITLLLVMSFAGMSFAEEQATAADLRLIKIEGNVTLTNDAGVKLPSVANMKLTSGTHIKTDGSGYAWLGLDETKFVKLDHSTDANVVKEGKLFKVNLDAGTIFFNVTAPLKDDEEMRIHTSTTITGIRGTMGMVTLEGEPGSPVIVQILEGSTINTVVNKETGANRSSMINADQTGRLTVPTQPILDEGTAIVIFGNTNDKVPGFVVDEMRSDSTIADRTAAANPSLDVPLLLGLREEELKRTTATTSIPKPGGSSRGSGSKKKKKADPEPDPTPDPEPVHTHSYDTEVSHVAVKDPNGRVASFDITYKCSCGETQTESDKRFNDVEAHQNPSYKALAGSMEEKTKGYERRDDGSVLAYGKCPETGCGVRIEIEYPDAETAQKDGVPVGN